MILAFEYNGRSHSWFGYGFFSYVKIISRDGSGVGIADGNLMLLNLTYVGIIRG